jgi:predicted HTH transcriptional regulator
LEDLNLEQVRNYIDQVKKVGRRPVPEGTTEIEFLERLNLLDNGIPTRAALFLFEFDTKTHGSFRVVLRSDRLTAAYLQSLTLNDKQIKAVLWLKSEGATITNERYRELLTVSKRTASNDLRALVDKGILEKHGKTGKGTYYTLSKAKGQ